MPGMKQALVIVLTERLLTIIVLLLRWYDINPQKSAKLNLIQNTESSKPTYKLDSLNNIPAVSFDGNDSLASTINMGMNGNPDFTFFVVSKVQGGAWGAFVASGGNYNCGLFAFTRLSGSNNGAIYTGFRNSGMYYSHANLGSSSIFAIHVWAREANNVNNTFTGNTAFVNGKSQTLLIAPGSTTCTPNIAASPLSVGTDTVGSYLIGNIAEIIIFDRALKAEDRKTIEQYLSKKWGIKLTS